MKKNLLFFAIFGCLFFVFSVNAQVSINNDGSSADPSAMLDIKADNKGLLVPKVQLVSLHSPDPIVNPAKGLIVHNMELSNPLLQTVAPGLYAWDGSMWRQITLPKGNGKNNLVFWDNEKFILMSPGLPGQILSVNSDSVLVWIYPGEGHTPTVTTSNATEIEQFRFTAGGNVVSDGGSVVTQRGICYGLNQNPDLSGSKISGGVGTGIFTVNITGLNQNTTYFFRAYALNNYDTAYGNQNSTTTLPLMVPTVITTNPVIIDQNTVATGGNVVSDGGSAVFFRGVCWDTLPNPNLDDSYTLDGQGTGIFTSTITNLVVGKKYYIRSYAINSLGLSFGNQVEVTPSCTSFLPVSVSISSPLTTVCSGDSVTVTATSVNQGSNPVYHWLVNGIQIGSNSAVFKYKPVSNDIVRCVVISSLACVTNNPDTSNSLTFTVNPLVQPAISILPSATVICTGTPVTFMATTQNGGLSPSYSWKVNGISMGSNNAVFSYTPSNQDYVLCFLTSSAMCTTTQLVHSDTIRLTVNPLLSVSVNISTPTNSVCSGTQVTFTATSINAGSNPVYQWKVNNINVGTGSTSFSYTPLNNDNVSCSLTSGLTCVTSGTVYSNVIQMSVTNLVTPTIAIYPFTNNICAGTTVAFAAVISNGGTNPQYQWKVNNTPMGTNSPNFSYIPANGDIVTCTLISNAPCVTINQVNSNQAVMSVISLKPVTIAISATPNPVCAQTSVTFTATITNGGNNPAYQWRVNGVPAGIGNPVFTYIPANNDVVNCTLTSDITCPSGNPALSNSITVQVIPLSQAGITVFTTSNPVCAGTSVTFNAVTTNAGVSPVFQWKVNGVNSGSNSPQFTFIPQNNDMVSCTLQSSTSCLSQNPVNSNFVQMTVNPILVPGLSISSSQSSVCAGNSVTLTATPTNGGANPAYTWYLNGNPVYSNGPVYTFNPQNGNVVSCKMVSSLTCNSGAVTSNNISIPVQPLLPVSVTVLISENPSCAGVPVLLTAVPVNGGTFPQFQWYRNGVLIPGANNITYQYIPQNNDIITCTLLSGENCTSGNPFTSAGLVIHVTDTQPASVSIAASANPVCNGSEVTFSATPVNGGQSPVYQWYVNGNPQGSNQPVFTWQPANNDQIQCKMTSNAVCPVGNPAFSNTITMIVNPVLPVNISITANANAVCEQTTVTFTSVLTNGGSSPMYQWKVNGTNTGSGASSLSYIPANNDAVQCFVTSNALCATGSPAQSNTINMQVTPLSQPVITITPSANPVCEGTNVTLTAVAINGGSSPAFLWKINGEMMGSNGNQYSYIPGPNDQITCELQSSLSCVTENPVTSNMIIMQVNPLIIPSVTISTSQNNVCAGSGITLNATIENGGTTPGITWKVNGQAVMIGFGSTSFTYSPQNGDNVTCAVTSSLPCASQNPVTSNGISVVVTPLIQASVSITASQNPVCPGTSVTLTSFPVNGGTNPAYQWFKNGVQETAATGSSFTYVPQNNDIVYCKMVSNENCVSGSPVISNSILIGVNSAAPVLVSITPSANSVCAGTAVTFTASTQNGGNSPIYQWVVNDNTIGVNNSVFTYNPLNNDKVSCILTSNIVCAENNPDTSNVITMIVNQVIPVSATISTNTNTVCQGTMVSFTVTPVNGGTSPSFQWMVNGSTVGAGNSQFSYIPSNNDAVKCIVTSNLECTGSNPATSNQINITVLPSLPAGITIAANNADVCDGSPVILTATALNGGSSPTYQWRVNGIPRGINNPVFTFIPVDNDQVECELLSNETCITGNPAVSNLIVIHVQPKADLLVNIAASQNPVCAGTPVTFLAMSVNGGTSPVYNWKVNGLPVGSNLEFYTYNPANGDHVTCTVTSDMSCINNSQVTSVPIIMGVNPMIPAAVTISTSQISVCEGTSVQFTANPVNGGTNPGYQWSVNGYPVVGATASIFNYTPGHSDVINCSMYSGLSCISQNPVPSNSITMTVNPKLVPSVQVTSSASVVCQGTLVNFSASCVNGGANPVYYWKVNGIHINDPGSTFSYTPQNGDQVQCDITSNYSCLVTPGASSNIIDMTVNPVTPAGITVVASANPVCAGASVSFEATSLNGGSAPVYQWSVNGNPVGMNSSVYSYIPADNDVITCEMTSNAVCPGNSAVTSAPVIMDVNPVLPVTVAINGPTGSGCAGAQVTFTAVVTNGGNNPTYNWIVNGVSSGIVTNCFTYTPNQGDKIHCVSASSESCTTGPAASDTITLNLTQPLPVSVTVATGPTTVCSGTQVTCIATVVNGGSSPLYQWYVNDILAGSDNSHFTFTPVNNDKVVCKVTSNLTCVSGNPANSVPVYFYVNPVVPVSLTISPSANPVCTGSSVTLTAIAANYGSNPVYQWVVNNSNVGENNPVYTYIPSDGDLVKCILTSNEICTTGNPATSDIISMQVHNMLYVGSVSSSQNVCSNTPPDLLTATYPSNGYNPTYQWQLSYDGSYFSNIEGATSISYQPPVLNDTVFYRQLQNASGTCGGPLPTNIIGINAISPVTPEITITMNAAGTIYQNTTVTFNAVISNGGDNPIVQWYVNGIPDGDNQLVFNYIPSDNDSITCVLTSNYTCVTSPSDTSNLIIVPVSGDPLLPVAVQISASPSGPVCTGSMVTYTAIPGNGGNNPVYQWHVNGNNTGANNPVFSYQPGNGDVVTCTMTSNQQNVTGNPALSNPITMQVNQFIQPSVMVGVSANPVCQGTAVTFLAAIQNGGQSPSVLWKVNGGIRSVNGAVFTYPPLNGDTVICEVSSSESCVIGNPAVSLPVIMQVNPPNPVSVTISCSETTVCNGSLVTLIANPVNGGTNPQYQWMVNGVSQGINQPSFTYLPSNGDIVTCSLNSNIICAVNNPAQSNPVIITVTPIKDVSVSIIASSTNICSGSTVTVTAIPVNGGSNPVYQWQVNGQVVGGNTNTYSFSPGNLDSITCRLTSGLSCTSGNPAYSNSIHFTVNPLKQVSVTVTPSANPVCAGSTVIYSAVAENGGTNPSYQWKINGTTTGATNQTYSAIPSNGDIVTCILTSNLACVSNNPAYSGPVIMTVNPILQLSATITASANNVCAGTTVYYFCTPTNAGSNPVYQWKVNNMPVGTNTPSYSYLPGNTDQVKCNITSTMTCLNKSSVNSNIITMDIKTISVVTNSITASANPVCLGNNVTLSSVYTNGGTTPTFQWTVNGTSQGSNQPSFTYMPQNGDVVTSTLYSSANCPSPVAATATPVTIVVTNPLPVSVAISASANPSCLGSQVTFTATPTNGGTSPTYLWKVNGNVIDGISSNTYSYSPVQGDSIYCFLTSSVNCATGNPAKSNTIIMTVNPVQTAAVSINSSNNNVCQGTLITYTAVPTNGGSSPVFQWKVNNNIVGSNNTTYSYMPANNDTIQCLMSSSLNCALPVPVASNKLGMVISSSPAAAVSISASGISVCNGTSVQCTATPTNGGTSPSYQWILNSNLTGTNNPVFAFTPVAGDTLKCVMTSSLQCVVQNPSTSGKIGFQVNPVGQASVTISASPSGPVCQGTTVVYSAVEINGGTAPGYQWKLDGAVIPGATNSSYAFKPANGNQISCIMTSSDPCISGSPATSNTIYMLVNPSATVTAAVWAQHYAVVSGTQDTYYAKVFNGGSSPVYNWYVNGSLVLSGSSSYSYVPANNHNIKCIVTSSLPGCLIGSPASSNTINMIVYTTGTPCSAAPTVIHQGRTYNSVQIGNQCWLRENMNVGNMIDVNLTQSNNSLPEKFCYNNDTMNCNVYGGLYQWAEMVQYLNNVTNLTHWNPLPAGVIQGICPSGWHIPSMAEAETLNGFLGSSTAGGKMKEAGTVHWNTPNSGASNSYGFTGLPCGDAYLGTFENLRSYLNIWTITRGPDYDYSADVFGAAYNFAIPTYGTVPKVSGYSVRCLKD